MSQVHCQVTHEVLHHRLDASGFQSDPGRGTPIKVPALTSDCGVIAMSDQSPTSLGHAMVWCLPPLPGGIHHHCHRPPLSGWSLIWGGGTPMLVMTLFPIWGVFSQHSAVPSPHHNLCTHHGCDIYTFGLITPFDATPYQPSTKYIHVRTKVNPPRDVPPPLTCHPPIEHIDSFFNPPPCTEHAHTTPNSAFGAKSLVFL